MKTELIWATPDGEKLLAYMARVSNPTATKETPFKKLLGYLIHKKHWSPMEMVNVCISVECARDVSRQFIRHRSFSFQEFSGRYATYDEGLLQPREARLQDNENRQNSLVSDDKNLNDWWLNVQNQIIELAGDVYKAALNRGIAKEIARTILPEGLVPTKMYVNGSLRSWIHYLELRCGPETQKEHREVAESIREIIYEQFPTVKEILNAD